MKIKNIFILLILLQLSVFANIAQIVAFKGEATVLRAGNIIEAKKGLRLLEKDEIKTKANTKLQLYFKDETIITIGQKSHFKIDFL